MCSTLLQVSLFSNVLAESQLLSCITAAGAGLSGSKMARRIGELDEFVFKEIGENGSKGVSLELFVSDSLLYSPPFWILWYEDRRKIYYYRRSQSMLLNFWVLEVTNLVLFFPVACSWDINLWTSFWSQRFCKALGKSWQKPGEVKSRLILFPQFSTVISCSNWIR